MVAKTGFKDRRREAPTGAQPHRWALSLWARTYRRLARRWVVTRHVRRYCRPFALDGAEHIERFPAPGLIVANHTSHFDTAIVLSLLTTRLYDRTAVVAAADRFYTSTIKGAWFSLRYNAFPINRGGGSGALTYSEWLLQNGWSLLMFPEGTRSRTGELLRFHPGPAILSLRQRVPVLPIHIDGAANILRPGTRLSHPAPVHVRVGPPVSFDNGVDAAEATQAIHDAVRTLIIPARHGEPARQGEPVLV